ncbi:ABC transporter ATP-binding protein [Szabonella alba]|uniref:ATP-binding cassette domain-containing protein n=1 Tax=Szabonella alba TaxID=2804194 RepID=A0A8K0VCM5_9RHOB|nr:ATP-binding cassette domain-containing protein [Szabonella alba]MBL4916842.1 ATP-binding cassette domain-containing protein [Szabonella alba]
MIEMNGVNHSIGRAAILQDITATLPRGRITALIGPNGAGKSTLLSLIARLEPVQQGQIRVEGLDIGQSDSRELARRLAILPQNAGVMSRLRVRELVGFGRWPHHQGRPGPADRRKVDEAMARLALTDLADRFLDQLSGGQRQRAHLAMTLAQDTDWLLLDEPLAALDMAHARALMAELAALRDAGRSVVMVLHEINHAAAWADHVLAMKGGRIHAEGTPAEVFTPGVLEPLYDMPLRIAQFEGRPMVLHHL